MPRAGRSRRCARLALRPPRGLAACARPPAGSGGEASSSTRSCGASTPSCEPPVAIGALERRARASRASPTASRRPATRCFGTTVLRREPTVVDVRGARRRTSTSCGSPLDGGVRDAHDRRGRPPRRVRPRARRLAPRRRSRSSCAAAATSARRPRRSTSTRTRSASGCAGSGSSPESTCAGTTG